MTQMGSDEANSVTISKPFQASASDKFDKVGINARYYLMFCEITFTLMKYEVRTWI